MDDNIRIKTVVVKSGKPGSFATAYTQKRDGIKDVVVEEKPNPWIELHDGTVHDALSLANWELKIPQYGCQCKKFYAEWKAENAPDFTSPGAFFAWGVRLHNAVNAKLGKPQLTIDEARKIWRSKDGLESEKA